jgi:hypothetical protein
MKKTIFLSLGLGTMLAMADTRFRVGRVDRFDGPPGRGVCEIRLQVDDTVEVTLDGDDVSMRTLSGRDGRDDGSACTMPLPRREVAGFDFDVREKRGDIQLVEGPTRRNGGRVIVRIHDGPSGFGRYIFRISWALEGAPTPPPIERRPDGDRHDGDDRRDGDAKRGDLRIVSAFWGAPGRGRDVTRLLQDRMRDGRIRIQASNDAMGGDPAVNVVKALVVVYEVRGRRQEARIPEGGFLELP